LRFSRQSFDFSSLDDLRALFIEELVATIGAEKLDLFVPQLLRVAIELSLALRAGYPENFRHDSSSYRGEKIRNPNIEIRNKLEVK
jgi:hypothetical protein